jgi:hypothetical protein
MSGRPQRPDADSGDEPLLQRRRTTGTAAVAAAVGSSDDDDDSGSLSADTDGSEDLMMTASQRRGAKNKKRAAEKAAKAAAVAAAAPPPPPAMLVVGMSKGMGAKVYLKLRGDHEISKETSFADAGARLRAALRAHLSRTTPPGSVDGAVFYWMHRDDRGQPAIRKPMNVLDSAEDFEDAVKDATLNKAGTKRRRDAKDKGGLLFAVQVSPEANTPAGAHSAPIRRASATP